jgi:hypothetical protein
MEVSITAQLLFPGSGGSSGGGGGGGGSSRSSVTLNSTALLTQVDMGVII